MQQEIAEKKTIEQLGLAFAIIFWILTLPLGANASDDDDDEEDDRIFVQGAPLAGSANGMFFDATDRLYVANVFGYKISVLDPDSGEIVDELGPDAGVFFPDDLTFASNGSLFWTDPAVGIVSRLTPSGESLVVASGFPFANPITVSDNGRLFFAQCFGGVANGIFEADPMGVTAPIPILQEGPGCASNGMDWRDGNLFSPCWFEGRVVRVDISTGALTNITTGWGAPAAVKFDSQGRLHAVNQGNGEVVRIDRSTGEREVLAVLPIGLDNLAFDSRDRLFVSSFTDAFVVEILDDGYIRTVSPGGMSVPASVAVIDDIVYVGEPQSLRSFDADDGDAVSVTHSVFGLGPLPFITSIATFGDNLILMSFRTGELMIWDPINETEVLTTLFAAPFDAQPFQGDLVVSVLGTGNVVRVSGPDLSQRETLAGGLLFPTGLAGTDEDLYVTEAGAARVVQIIRNGEVLDPPEPVIIGLNLPEGIALRSDEDDRLLVVEAGAGSLREFDLESGRIRTIATDLEFYPALPPGLPLGYCFNDVAVDDDGAIYVNGGGANVIYKFDDDDADDDSDSDSDDD